MFQQARINILRINKRKNVQRSGYTNTERAQCVIWISQDYGATDVQGLFQEAYRRNPPGRCMIRQWREDYRERGGKWTPANKHCRAESNSRLVNC